MSTAPARAPPTTRHALRCQAFRRYRSPMNTTALAVLGLGLLLATSHPALATDWARFLADVGCTANPSSCRPPPSPTDRRLDALEDQADALQRQLNTETDDRLRERYEAERDADTHPARRPLDPLVW